MTSHAKLQADRIIFVLIDLQPKLLERIPEAKSIVSANRVLMETAFLLGCPRIGTSQNQKRLGEVVPVVGPLLSGPILDKTGFSCLSSPEFQNRLEQYDRDWIVVSGIETHICVLQTCLDLRNRDLQIAVVTDAIGAGSKEDHERGIQRMEKAGTLMVTTEMLVYELLGTSESPAFRQLLPKIKELRKG
jgi:isochorismate hydrolase